MGDGLSVAPTHGPTDSTSIDYDFSSGGWNSIFTGQSVTVAAETVHSLGGATARYIGIEIIANGGDATRAGFQEVGISVPEPSTFAFIGLAGIALFIRRRRS